MKRFHIKSAHLFICLFSFSLTAMANEDGKLKNQVKHETPFKKAKDSCESVVLDIEEIKTPETKSPEEEHKNYPWFQTEGFFLKACTQPERWQQEQASQTKQGKLARGTCWTSSLCGGVSWLATIGALTAGAAAYKYTPDISEYYSDYWYNYWYSHFNGSSYNLGSEDPYGAEPLYSLMVAIGTTAAAAVTAGVSSCSCLAAHGFFSKKKSQIPNKRKKSTAWTWRVTQCGHGECLQAYIDEQKISDDSKYSPEHLCPLGKYTLRHAVVIQSYDQPISLAAFLEMEKNKDNFPEGSSPVTKSKRIEWLDLRPDQREQIINAFEAFQTNMSPESES